MRRKVTISNIAYTIEHFLACITGSRAVTSTFAWVGPLLSRIEREGLK